MFHALLLNAIRQDAGFGAREGQAASLSDVAGHPPADIPNPNPNPDIIAIEQGGRVPFPPSKPWASKCAELEEWDQKKCGGWAPHELKEAGGDVPESYKQSVIRYSTPNPEVDTDILPHEKKLLARPDTIAPWSGRGKGGIFCYAIVVNPPEPTFDMLRKLTSECDGYLFFSNFSDPARDIKKVIFGPLRVPGGGEWGSALNTPVFLPVWRYVATKLAKKFDWFLKTDADTLYQPYKLRKTLSMYDHTKASQINGAMGPMGMMPQGAYLRYLQHLPDCEAEISLLWPQEDMYIAGQVWDKRKETEDYDKIPFPTKCSFVDVAYDWEAEKMDQFGACR